MNDYHPCLTNSPDKFSSLLGFWDVCGQDAVSMRSSGVGVGSSPLDFPSSTMDSTGLDGLCEAVIQLCACAPDTKY